MLSSPSTSLPRALAELTCAKMDKNYLYLPACSRLSRVTLMMRVGYTRRSASSPF